MAQGSQRVRVLHLSDLHVGGRLQPPYASRYAPEVLEKLARRIFEIGNDIHAILISGDLCASGTAGDLTQAAVVVSGAVGPAACPWLSPQKLPTLQAAGKVVSLMPGNHDRYSGYYSGAGGTQFDSVFAGYWQEGIGGVEECLLPASNRPVLAILKADFTLARTGDAQGPWGRLGQGKVYQDRLSTLVAKTRQLHPLPVVWMVHFAPLLETAKLENDGNYKLDPALRLLDGQQLVDEAIKCSVRHILCGHSHDGLLYWAGVGGKVRVYMAGTACCTGTRNDTCAHLREMTVEGGVLTVRSICLAWRPEVGVGGDFVWEREKEM